MVYKSVPQTRHSIPLFQEKASAELSFSGENYAEKSLDLNELLINHPLQTFFIRVQSNSMEHVGISINDILVVDRAIAASDNKIVIVCINDELTVKRIRRVGDHLFLMLESPGCRPIKITEDMDFEIWGVVTNIIHQV